MNSISPNLNIMIKACEKASKAIIRDFGQIENLQVSKKGPKDFVTKTDKKVEKILIEELSKAKKNYSFITEESGIIKNKNEDAYWIIDPIKNEIFYAEKNSGAYFNNHRVRVSSKINLEEGLFSSNSDGVKYATPH